MWIYVNLCESECSHCRCLLVTLPQVVPFRGNLDAVNVHPFEFVPGEYLHLLSMFLLPQVHVGAVLCFIVLGGFMATLNHTRIDINFWPVYTVKAHDVHHRIPQSNYGQYTMFWDRVFGAYRPHTVRAKST
eukprot:m.33894 g.33894  ORF g.33894 m.33894 type:complete len:131 (-) comp12962_c0_seq1:81-473(-)